MRNQEMETPALRAKHQLASFRLVELKDCLQCLSLPRQGKKQILIDRLLTALGFSPQDDVILASKTEARTLRHPLTPDHAASIIDKVFRKMKGLDVAEGPEEGLAAIAAVGGRSLPLKAEITGIRCPCGMSLQSAEMLQCKGKDCGVRQHVKCVIIPEKSPDGTTNPEAGPEIPAHFFCELCRLDRGDPFTLAIEHPLMAVKLRAQAVNNFSSSQLQSVERTFNITQRQRELLRTPGTDLQVWAMQLSDKAPFRIHWPAHSDVRINGVSVRVINRPGQQLLGANGRDEAASIKVMVQEGVNRLSVSAYDMRPFIVGIRLIRRRTLHQVLHMIPSEGVGESYEAALARVQRRVCLGQGSASSPGNENGSENGSSDLEVVEDHVMLSLRCPMSGSRMQIAARFRDCQHMTGFDLHTLVMINERARKWQCPVCLTTYTVSDIVVDPYFNSIVREIASLPGDISDVEIRADGSWRPRPEGGVSERGAWRSPGNGKHAGPSSHLTGEIANAGGNADSLRLGLKRSRNGSWAISRAPNGVQPAGSAASETSSAALDDASSKANWVNEVLGAQRSRPAAALSAAAVAGSNQGATSALIVLSDSDSDDTSPTRRGPPAGAGAAPEPTSSLLSWPAFAPPGNMPPVGTAMISPVAISPARMGSSPKGMSSLPEQRLLPGTAASMPLVAREMSGNGGFFHTLDAVGNGVNDAFAQYPSSAAWLATPGSPLLNVNDILQDDLIDSHLDSPASTANVLLGLGMGSPLSDRDAPVRGPRVASRPHRQFVLFESDSDASR